MASAIEVVRLIMMNRVIYVAVSQFHNQGSKKV